MYFELYLLFYQSIIDYKMNMISFQTEFRKIYKCLMEDDASFQGFYLEER